MAPRRSRTRKYHISSGDRVKVTEGMFTYVAIGNDGRPRPVEAG